jgi:hypothetical protein
MFWQVMPSEKISFSLQWKAIEHLGPLILQCTACEEIFEVGETIAVVRNHRDAPIMRFHDICLRQVQTLIDSFIGASDRKKVN